MSGTPSTPEESALPVFISGLRRSAYRVANGRCILSGMRSDEKDVDCNVHSVRQGRVIRQHVEVATTTGSEIVRPDFRPVTSNVTR